MGHTGGMSTIAAAELETVPLRPDDDRAPAGGFRQRGGGVGAYSWSEG